MASDLPVPFGYRFDPTDEELICCLDWKRIDPNDPRITFIPDIKVNDHEPLELAGLGTVKGKDSVYFFGCWASYGKRKSRKVKKDSVNGCWEAVSRAPVKIKSSDGTQIGSRTNFIYNVGGPTGWHMEEYCRDGQVSICRVYNKCSQEQGTTKIDAKEILSDDLQISHSAPESYNFKAQEEGQHYRYDENFHRMLRDLCNRFDDQDQTLQSSLKTILERFENECPLPKNSKRKWEAGPSSERETLHMDSGREINGQKDGGPPSCCGLRSAWPTPEETCRENLYGMSPHLNVTTFVNNLTTETWVYSEDDNFHNWGKRAEDYLLMDDATKMGNCQHEPPGFAPLQGFDALRFVFPDHSYASCSNAAEEYIDNPDTGNCQIADDIRMDLNDLIEILSRPLSPVHSYPICSKAAEEYVDNPDSGNGQIADDTVPMEMDDETKTGTCVSSPVDSLEEIFHGLEPLKELEDLHFSQSG